MSFPGAAPPYAARCTHLCLSAWLPWACGFANLNRGQFLHFQQKVNLPEATHQVRGKGGRKSGSGIFLSNMAHCLSRGPQLLSAFLLPITYIFKVEHVTFSTFPLIHSFLYVWISLYVTTFHQWFHLYIISKPKEAMNQQSDKTEISTFAHLSRHRTRRSLRNQVTA